MKTKKPNTALPMQPVELDQHGVVRFRRNRLVEYLLDHGGIDMNALAHFAIKNGVPDEERDQFAQLTGYSVSGWSDLSYVSDKQWRKADQKRAKVLAEVSKGALGYRQHDLS